MMRKALLILAAVLAVLAVWQFLKVFELIDKGPPEGSLTLLSALVILIIVYRQKDRSA
jgi:uncharacterized membrane protein YidH (DUF202 family)